MIVFWEERWSRGSLLANTPVFGHHYSATSRRCQSDRDARIPVERMPVTAREASIDPTSNVSSNHSGLRAGMAVVSKWLAPRGGFADILPCRCASVLVSGWVAAAISARQPSFSQQYAAAPPPKETLLVCSCCCATVAIVSCPCGTGRLGL